MSKYQVIFHIDELNKWGLLLKNVSNLLDAVGDDEFSIEVLANAEAVKFYDAGQKSDLDLDLIRNLNNKGVKFIACNNALRAFDLKKADLLKFVTIVPVGVIELIIKQSKGYAYIRP
ncbi:MAG: hypothetical protein GX921_10215 [Bacteroidales bacterium]|nr:hypothetical protein [Bacteroidales bacterium]